MSTTEAIIRELGRFDRSIFLDAIVHSTTLHKRDRHLLLTIAATLADRGTMRATLAPDRMQALMDCGQTTYYAALNRVIAQGWLRCLTPTKHRDREWQILIPNERRLDDEPED